MNEVITATASYHVGGGIAEQSVCRTVSGSPQGRRACTEQSLDVRREGVINPRIHRVITLVGTFDDCANHRDVVTSVVL